MLSEADEAFAKLPPMSCGTIYNAAAMAVDQSNRTLGQVLEVRTKVTLRPHQCCSGSGYRRVHTAG